MSGQERRRRGRADTEFSLVQNLSDAIVESDGILDVVGLGFKLLHEQPEEAIGQVVNGVPIDMIAKGRGQCGVEVVPVVASIFA